MGLTAATMKWIYLTKLKYGVNFDHMLTLGRQYCAGEEWEKAIKWLRARGGASLARQKDGYTETFWKWMGSKKIEFMDYSAYEGADVIWDLNQPIPAHSRNRYSVVVDGGTLEHVYNYPQALRNAMEMVEIGGHLILMTPTNGQCGHGFYQFSPCLFWDLLNAKNGYRILETSLCDTGRESTSKMMRKVEGDNKFEIIETKGPSILLVIAERIGDVPEILEVQQGSYKVVWEKAAHKGKGTKKQSAFIVSARSALRKYKTMRRLYAWTKGIAKDRGYYDVGKEIEHYLK